MKTDQIDGATRLFVIVGDPIHGVRTPTLFNEMFGRKNINAVMVAHHVAAADIEAAWRGLKTLKNLDGIVITMPHKTPMCDLVDSLGINGRAAGAINAARRKSDGTWEGDMFDGIGCVDGLRRQGHEVTGKSAFLIGVGGAGSAVASALAHAGIKRLVIQDIDSARLDRAIERIRAAYPELSVDSGTLGDGPFDLAINATPVGMQRDDPLPFDPSPLPTSTLIVDVIIKPEITPLLTLAQETGHEIQPGKHMHRGQAIAAARFFGFDLES
ncbi:MAG: shikimate dehydrogenase [Candidatus Accumulibacter sp.]|jgi:shikimate dehydrogenase|nr:shikimate dehydrogenase [Accumulibacter sp.]